MGRYSGHSERNKSSAIPQQTKNTSGKNDPRTPSPRIPYGVRIPSPPDTTTVNKCPSERTDSRNVTQQNDARNNRTTLLEYIYYEGPREYLVQSKDGLNIFWMYGAPNRTGTPLKSLPLGADKSMFVGPRAKKYFKILKQIH